VQEPSRWGLIRSGGRTGRRIVVWAGEGRSAAAVAHSGRAYQRDLLRSGRIGLGLVGRRRAVGSGVGGRQVLLRRLRGSVAVSGLGAVAHTWTRCEVWARCRWVRGGEWARGRRVRCEVCARCS
jgi:hypothetical protein